MTTLNRTFLPLAMLALLAAPMVAQGMGEEGPVPATALIKATSKSNAPLDPAALKLQVNGHESPITSVVQVPPARTEIAILIDDGLRASFNSQIKDITDFVNGLPEGAKVLIGYMQNGEIRTPVPGFSADHEKALSALRITMSSPGMSASPYFCLSTFVKAWPSREIAPRFVLMVTNGVDPYNGSTSPMNQDSPYVKDAQEDAQRAGVAVYSIYASGQGMRGGGVAISGQNYLQQVGDATGGELLSGGITPVSFAPFLKEFSKDIMESYTLSFMAPPGKGKGSTLVPIKVKTSQPGEKVKAPEGVHPGGEAVRE